MSPDPQTTSEIQAIIANFDGEALAREMQHRISNIGEEAAATVQILQETLMRIDEILGEKIVDPAISPNRS